VELRNCIAIRTTWVYIVTATAEEPTSALPLNDATAFGNMVVRNLPKKIELVAHIAIIVVAILVSVVLVKRFLLPRTHEPAAPSQIKIGTRLSLPGVEWAHSGRTVILVLSKDCRFCTASASLYQQIATERTALKNVRMVAFFPQPVGDARKYLNDLGVVVDDVKQVRLDALGVSGTPTLIFVDGTGTVQRVWTGKLPPDKASEVLSELRREG
jgi:thioredoxin-related protein